MGNAVQIQNIGESWFSRPPSDAIFPAGCQIEVSQKEQAQLTMEGDKPYTVSWRVIIIYLLVR